MDWSLIPKQTYLVENGQVGDCWRCCIAAVLGLPAEEVPHFLLGKDGELNTSVDADTQRWLSERGYWMAHAWAVGTVGFQFPRWSGHGDLPPLISCGPTERSRGLGKHHAVVTIGNDIVYDPHPSEAGLTAVTEQYLIFKTPDHEMLTANTLRKPRR